MTRAVLSIGSNLGDRLTYLQSAVDGLVPTVDGVSSVYETLPWGVTDHPRYLNAVIIASDPDADPYDWLSRALKLEEGAGRPGRHGRGPHDPPAPRTLDIDIVAVWQDDGVPVHIREPDLTIPHPRAHLRAFVLVPWLEVDPGALLPGYGRVQKLVATTEIAADVPGIVRRDDAHLAVSNT